MIDGGGGECMMDQVGGTWSQGGGTAAGDNPMNAMILDSVGKSDKSLAGLDRNVRILPKSFSQIVEGRIPILDGACFQETKWV